MAGVPLKFRCYQCNRLLGVSLSKVGSVVSCPKCGAGLVVPPPVEETAEPDDVTEAPGPLDSPPDTPEGAVSFDFLDIRPEDIRVEPGVAEVPYSPPTPRPPAPPVEDAPIVVREPAPPPVPPPPVAPAIAPNPVAKTEEPAEVVIPPIRLDGPRSAPSTSLPIRSRDVVLPRSAVATWSLFVLVAQGLAFLAGLLAGHFLWRVH